MPKVLCEAGYVFFSNEGNPKEPCHIHVRKDTSLAKFWIGDKIELASSYGFSAKDLNEIKSIAENNKKKLQEAWNEFFK